VLYCTALSIPYFSKLSQSNLYLDASSDGDTSQTPSKVKSNILIKQTSTNNDNSVDIW